MKTKVDVLMTMVLALVLVFFQIAVVQAEDKASFAEIERIVLKAKDEFGTPGISVALVINDELVWAKGYGLADVENQVPAKADTVYRVASISKPMAATAVMQLVERGLVDIDSHIQQYVSYFPKKPLEITVRNVMTHTSGVRHYKPGEMEMKDHFESVEDAIEIFKDDPLLFTPGTLYKYSSYAYNLLAGVVERASGLTFEAYMMEHVWEPAGMTATRLEHQGEIVPHRASQYVKAGPNGEVENAPFADLSIKWAGGGIISTAEDLARFHIALNTGKLLQASTLEEMYVPFKLADGNMTDYGLGWSIYNDELGQRWVGHGGGATGGSTYLLRHPEKKLAVAIMCNVQNAGDRRKLALDIIAAATAER